MIKEDANKALEVICERYAVGGKEDKEEEEEEQAVFKKISYQQVLESLETLTLYEL